MTPGTKLSHRLTFTGLLLFIIVSLLSCRKERDNPEEEKMPVPGTCKPVEPSGRLTLDSIGKFTYATSGGGKITVDIRHSISLTHKDYNGFFIQFWGDVDNDNTAASHENLNGKHLKDWKGTKRTVIFPDGAKITMVSGKMFHSLVSISIYDGAEVHIYNVTCNTLEYSSGSSSFADELDAAEADGETSTFEITETGLKYFNLYQEDTPGKKVEDRYDLGELNRDNPNQVHDLYDDTRLGHT